MSSSGLIYAVIVGAWAAYLVPMWLRRQDELNESRPTERFSTAIRLLSGRAAMERKVAKGRTAEDSAEEDDEGADTGQDEASDGPSEPPVRGGGAAVPGLAPIPAAAPAPASARPRAYAGASASGADPATGAARRRADLLARRRRLVTTLFMAFTLGMIIAGVCGPAFLWAPAIPAVLFSLYIAHLRRQERRRLADRLDRRAEPAPAPVPAPAPAPASARAPRRHEQRSYHVAADYQESEPDRTSEEPPAPAATPPGHHSVRTPAPDLDEFADPDESGDDLAETADSPDGWEPVPVPLPTYVTAPVAPRSTGALDLGAPDAWSAARGEQPPAAPHPQPQPRAERRRPPRTPLFDQYADDHRPAANE